MEGEAILFIIFVIFVPLILGCSVGVLLTKMAENKTGEKPTYNTIKFYIGVPCCIFMFIGISLFMMFVQ